jgi:hypothetical protein
MSMFAKKQDSRGEADPSRPAELGAPPSPGAPTGSRGGYSIADAIHLMRSLPVDQNVDLVVRVVRATLASVNVKVQDIIEDAARKEKSIQEGISVLHGKVKELEKELEGRRREITALETELKETTGVKERLQLAERSVTTTPPPIPATSGESPIGKTGATSPLPASKPHSP